jgi:hypothetical protein
MKSFQDYVKIREDIGEAPTDMTFGHPDKAKMDTLFKLIKMAWDRNRGDVMEFFEKLADNDPDMQDVLKKLNGPEAGQSRKGNGIGHEDMRDRDEFHPPEADMNPGADSGDWD